VLLDSKNIFIKKNLKSFKITFSVGKNAIIAKIKP
jgi:hypothetical protein